MREDIQQLAGEGYVGELFPFAVEGNHGSEDGQVRAWGCEDENGWMYCQEWNKNCPVKWPATCMAHYVGYGPACLLSECKLWSWYQYDVLLKSCGSVLT